MEGHIYFLKAEGLPMVKIGYTTGKPNVRKDGIQTMSPVWLYRIGLLKTADCRGAEKRLHTLFQPLHRWGEWFEFPDEMLGTLKRSVRRKKKIWKRSKETSAAFDMDAFESFWKREFENNLWL